MMAASGTVYLAKTAPLATVAADGTFCLTLLAKAAHVTTHHHPEPIAS